MTFLQPFILWALPLVLVPVIIHLINRLRHRRQPWAAMRFLLSATRSSISHAKLRQILVLLFRVLAVLMLILFLSRPLAGGWLGWALSPAPDAILILLDRSASMETKLPGSAVTRREQAIKLLSDAAKGFQRASHVVLIDSALRLPQEVANIGALHELSLTAATDTAADIPAMLQVATQWLIENRAGTAEIWIASDLQQSNWLPDDSRWKSVTTQLASLPQKVRVRLLSFEPSPEPNTSITLKELVRRPSAERAELQLALDLQRPEKSKETIPLTLSLDGVTSQHEMMMDGELLRWRHKASLGAKKGSGWGACTLPADSNARDNKTFFVYGAETPLRACIVSADAPSGRYFQLAASVLAASGVSPKPVTSPSAAPILDWSDSTLIVWQGPFPTEATAEKIRSFVQEGGAVAFFPAGGPDAQQFNGVAWSEVQSAEPDKSFRVLRWDEDQGPLAKTDEGISLPLGQTVFQRRQPAVAAKSALAVLAAFDDGTPFLTRQTAGKGEIYFCASLPNRDWSSLGEGPVLVPMMQRWLLMGSQRLQQASLIACGELSPAEREKKWAPVESTAGQDASLEAGVYRSGERLLAVNRPVAEDERAVLDTAQVGRLFGDLSFQMLEDRRGSNSPLQGEIWRMLLLGMLLFLIVEGILVLPARTMQRGQAVVRGTVPVQEREATEVSP
ncbi:MAG: BatA domain-containing protein, partial [Verrucomicrobiales bacterium]|nr:BatA domain-containing protein [Verrucomicrobiales bacterium]